MACPFRPSPSGSIPARAGEPINGFPWHGQGGVYPRTCGGTGRPRAVAASSQGLSPHVRGNLRQRLGCRVGDGSIPARAGEPVSGISLAIGHRVYPRTCGGTQFGICLGRSLWGLSPHVRGNRLGLDPLAGGRGSIPARAGEPGMDHWLRRHLRVYPRTCGGTWLVLAKRLDMQGLSPHVRGNPAFGAHCQNDIGSIPARAGEPASGVVSGHPQGVYPRTCGGTYSVLDFLIYCQGLSPHVRGNRSLTFV